MQIVVTAIGCTPSEKPRALEIIKQALLVSGAQAEPIEVRLGVARNSKAKRQEIDKFTVAASPSGRACGSDGHRETWSMNPGFQGFPQVARAGQWQGTFRNQAAARLFISVMSATAEQRGAIDAILGLDAPEHDSPISMAHIAPKNCQGGGGDFTKGAGVISAEMAPAIDARDRALAVDGKLWDAAYALYCAGKWKIDGYTKHSIAEQIELWTNLRDALGLPKGTATGLGVGANQSQPEDPDKAYLRGALGRMVDRWEKQRGEIGTLHDMLATVADVFDIDAEEHQHKANNELHESRRKLAAKMAQRNWRLARMCRAPIPDFEEVPPNDVVDFPTLSDSLR